VRVHRLDHVQLAMPTGREDDARAFYAGVLGLEEVEKPAPMRSSGGCWFAGGTARLHLGVETGFQPARKAHPALVVDGLGAAAEELRAAGAPVEPDDRWPGVRRLFTADPFGNRIELIDRASGDQRAYGTD